jgi:hypothetical protein
LNEAGRKEDEGPRTGVEATQSGSILMKKGLETMKATLKKAWLEDLMQFVKRQGGDTCEVMGHTLKLDGGRGILATVVALNKALRTEHNLSGGSSLCPEFGYCFPEADQFVAAGGFGEVHHIFLSSPSPAPTVRSI